jgi:hypothetical protein
MLDRLLYIPTVIFIEILEGSVEVLFSVHSVHVHCCSYELIIVYCTISICISLLFLYLSDYYYYGNQHVQVLELLKTIAFTEIAPYFNLLF